MKNNKGIEGRPEGFLFLEEFAESLGLCNIDKEAVKVLHDLYSDLHRAEFYEKDTVVKDMYVFCRRKHINTTSYGSKEFEDILLSKLNSKNRDEKRIAHGLGTSIGAILLPLTKDAEMMHKSWPDTPDHHRS
jgi:hypothetical protein